MEHLVIVGAGMAGLATAWHLQERGLRVTVVDRTAVAAGASWGNAGQINPAFTVPLPAPGMVRYGLRAALTPAAPLAVPITADRHWWRFLIQFAAHCTAARRRHAMSVLTELTSRSVDAYDELAAGGVTTPLQNATPLLAACGTLRERTHVQRELDTVSAHGTEVTYDLADGDELRALEPILSPHVRTGLRVHGQRYLNPPAYLAALARSVRARGGEIREGVTITGVTDLGTAVELSTTTGSRLRADAAVLATGAWLTPLARRFGVRRPVQAGRGYSFSIQPETLPTHPIYLPERKIVCTPLGDRFRVTGMMELCPPGAAPETRRVRAIIRSARPMLTGVDWHNRRDQWSGARPLTPDGLPLVGSTASPRVHVTGGHGMWGMIHGPITGKLLAGMITGRFAPEWTRHLRPQR